MQRLDVSGAVRPIYGSLGVKRLIIVCRAYSVQKLHILGVVNVCFVTLTAKSGPFCSGIYKYKSQLTALKYNFRLKY